MKKILDLLKEHPFFRELTEKNLELVAGCSKNVHFPAGQMIFREGEDANRFFVIREGKVSLEIHSPEHHGLPIQTLGPGDVLGFSWLFEPYRWSFDARVVEPVRATEVDGACLRGKCEEDHELGYQFTRRFAQIAVRRLQATRVQLLDLYGHPVEG